jgi:hypothetical protein
MKGGGGGGCGILTNWLLESLMSVQLLPEPFFL